ncbi:MAG TPA: sodium:proton antiporter [Anaeromyxobacter sp.]|nr:sodium:proton antiporter [Anaeromyxobacter sp.]
MVPVPPTAAVKPLGAVLPLWSVLPFAAMLLCIAVLPLAAPRFWEHNRNKALVAAVLGAPVALWIGALDRGALVHAAREYVAFIVLLGALFSISGGIVVRGTLSGTPGLNAVLLGLGAVLASFIGTTGASMVLVRPLLRANSVRRRNAHVFVFFIFVVSNAGGLLTPLGDPPLFLGFLRGVPFLWTLRLLPVWLLVNGALVVLFYMVDSTIFRAEDLETPGDLDEMAARHQVPVHVVGKRNLVWLAGVVGVLVAAGRWRLPPGTAEAGMLALVALSWFGTPRALHEENGFGFAPIVEVAVLFAGIFATMIPALAVLNARGASLGLSAEWHFFWASGLLSSFLDNAPTYLTFASVASGLLGTDAANLAELVAHPRGAPLLSAVSAGAVLMGANTYIGNGPNFMVKAIAEQAGVRMPSFFGYMGWAMAVLVPLFVAVTFAFYR